MLYEGSSMQKDHFWAVFPAFEPDKKKIWTKNQWTKVTLLFVVLDIYVYIYYLLSK